MPRFINLDRLTLPPRPMDAREQLERVLTALKEDYGAEKIIAFGSSVRGTATEHSDVDLCVIRKHPPGTTHPDLDSNLAVGHRRPRISPAWSCARRSNSPMPRENPSESWMRSSITAWRFMKGDPLNPQDWLKTPHDV
jgi:hypothetical protein